jgi:hypothetical protein
MKRVIDMNWKASAWFAAASLMQASVITIGDWSGFSTFEADLELWQLLVHIAVGQIAGYILLVLFRKYRALVGKYGGASFGILYGLAIWGIVLSLGTAVGLVRSTGWQSGNGMMTTILAFLVYGMITGAAAGDLVKDKVHAG